MSVCGKVRKVADRVKGVKERWMNSEWNKE